MEVFQSRERGFTRNFTQGAHSVGTKHVGKTVKKKSKERGSSERVSDTFRFVSLNGTPVTEKMSLRGKKEAARTQHRSNCSSGGVVRPPMPALLEGETRRNP